MRVVVGIIASKKYLIAKLAGIVEYKNIAAEEFWCEDRSGKFTIQFLNNSVKDYIRRYYYPNGNLAKESEYKNFSYYGWERYYHKTGNLARRKHYVDVGYNASGPRGYYTEYYSLGGIFTNHMINIHVSPDGRHIKFLYDKGYNIDYIFELSAKEREELCIKK